MIGVAALPAFRRPRLSPTLSRYIARQYVVWFLSIYFGLAFVIFIVGGVDLLDRLSGKTESGIGLVLEMALLRLPFLTQEVLPLTVLAAGMLTFWRLTRGNELVAARAAGVSAWQFLLPVVASAAAVGLLAITLLNPLATLLLTRFEQMEARYIRNAPSILTVSESGLWLRQADREGHTVIHAERADQASMTLSEVTVFRFDRTGDFLERLDAARARLLPGEWRFAEAWVSRPRERSVLKPSESIGTELTAGKILESFSPPETISFWQLPGFIELLRRAGFSAQRHLLQLHRLLALPLLLSAMVLLAAAFSLRGQRRGRVGLVVLIGVLTVVLLHFLSNFVFALGLSGKIPVILAAWTPAGMSLLLGTSLLLHLEDG